MKSAFFSPSLSACLVLGLLLGGSGCSSLSVADSGGAEPVTNGEDASKKLAEAQAELESANARLAIAKMQSVAYDAKQSAAEENARVELALAEQKLVWFDKYTMPGRLSQENLNLKSTKESAAEAQEELEQIELMYKDQDLNDMTREFVVARGRRNAERAQARIQIREANLAGIELHELPMERMRLELAINRAQQALANLALETEIGRRSKELAVTEATSKVEQATEALAKLSEGASS